MTGIGRGRTAVLAIVWILCVGYLALRADRGWIPADEGLLAQSAERVLAGELPHRDFDDTYTGGLALLHAAAFLAFGVELGSLRLALLLFSAAFVPIVYWIAARFVPPLIAGLLTLLAVAWSLPNYFAGLPSWYNLFLVTFGTAAVLRHADTGRRRWLFLAGLAGGLAILIKPIGLYYVAAVVLYLVYREQLSRGGDLDDGAGTGTVDRAPPSGVRPGAFSMMALVGLILFVAVISVLVSAYGGLMAVVHFVLPTATLCGFLAWHELQSPRTGLRAWMRAIARPLAPFAAGLGVACGAFLVPYLASGSIGALFQGAFILPQRRFEFAVFDLPSAVTLVAAVPLAALLLVPFLRRDGGDAAGGAAWPWEWVLLVPGAMVLAIALVFAGEEFVYRAVWYSVRPTVPLAVAAGAAVLVVATRSRTLATTRRLELFLVLAVTALVNLVQFPYAFGIYFCYAAPLTVLAIAVVVACQESPPARLHLCLLAFYLAFALVWLNRGFVRDIGGRFTNVRQDTRLGLPRADLRVSAPEADLYTRLVEQIRAHSADDAFIFATPDSPHVYFLAARKNPTRTFYDFFDADYTDAPARRRRILELIDERRVEVVVVHWQPDFSHTFDPELIAALARRFPNRATVAIDTFPGPASFTVRWRDPAAPGADREAESAE